MRWRSGAAIVGGLAILATPAWAGDAQCVWRGLPAEARDATYAAYVRHGAEGLSETTIANADVLQSLASCGHRQPLTPAGAAALGPALVGAALQATAARLLSERSAIREAQLERAWARLPLKDREWLVKTYLPLQGPDNLIADARAAAILTRAVGLVGAAPVSKVQTDHLLDYFRGKAQAQAYQRLF